MQAYRIKLSFWTTPITIYAESIYHARAKALEQFPVCDCGCDQKTTIDFVGKLSPKLKGVGHGGFAQQLPA